MNRLVAALPDSVAKLCLIRLGLIVVRLTALPYVWGLSQAVQGASRQPEAAEHGLLHSERLRVNLRHLVFLQSWASFDQMEAWSHRSPHADWWHAANSRMRTRGDLAIYHESYLVPRNGVESIYLNCPPVGLALFGTTGSAERNLTTSRDRLMRRQATQAGG